MANPFAADSYQICIRCSLRKLTKKSRSFHWNQTQENAIQKLKKLLRTAPSPLRWHTMIEDTFANAYVKKEQEEL